MAGLRIARIIDRLNVGGPAKHVVWLTEGLGRLGHRTALITGRIAAGEGDMSYLASSAGIEPLVIPGMSRAISPRDALVTLRILRELFRLRPHVIHTHKAKAGTVGRLAATLYRWLTPSALRLRPRPCHVVHTYHGHVFHSYYGRVASAFFVAIERVLARVCTDTIVVLSEGQRRDITERFRIAPAEKVRVVPLGIDLDEVGGAAPVRAELGLGPDVAVVGTVGRLCEIKNYDLLLDAAARLAAGDGPPHFLIVGDGHLRGQLEARAGRLGVDRLVHFLGFRHDAATLYADFDLVALSSLNEGTPVTLLEAMAAGRPVVATEVGGVADIMGNRQLERDGLTVWDHGVTVRSGDSEAFARALRLLIDRPDLRREMGTCGRTCARAARSVSRLVRDIDMLYRELGLSSAASGPGAPPTTRDEAGEGVEDAGPDHRWGGLHRLAPR